ncbi:hypothetical protein chiPu_0025448 [Chiloscyllium punctatum]|uniref:Uncharacterized protein n=1 Tax=Chiloscyllium punctatum TaxID=137246 RepID=A0A401TEF3_CHIPU|nr:hypothetical protein [Chiloscyllium punctatum]
MPSRGIQPPAPRAAGSVNTSRQRSPTDSMCLVVTRARPTVTVTAMCCCNQMVPETWSILGGQQTVWDQRFHSSQSSHALNNRHPVRVLL